MSVNRFIFVNGVVSSSSDTPTVSTFLESHPGAYTTTRTHNNGSLLMFWERHLRRLANSARILFNSNPKLLFESEKSMDSFSLALTQSSRWESTIQSLVNDSMSKLLPMTLKERKSGLLISLYMPRYMCLLRSGFEKMVHVWPWWVMGGMSPMLSILIGLGRLRKPLEKLRPPSATELLLSNDGDQILEGCVTNFFVVCSKDHNDSSNDACGKELHDCSTYPFEIQTAPIRDGALPGVIRQVIIDICSSNGIPLREVAPSWSKREIWREAFVTNSLRLLQHVETIQVPSSWKLLESKSWKDVKWEEKRFKEVPGRITSVIQKEIMKKTGIEGYPIALFPG